MVKNYDYLYLPLLFDLNIPIFFLHLSLFFLSFLLLFRCALSPVAGVLTHPLSLSKQRNPTSKPPSGPFLMLTSTPSNSAIPY